MRSFRVGAVLAAVASALVLALCTSPSGARGDDYNAPREILEDLVEFDFETENTPASCLIIDDVANNRWVVQIAVYYESVGARFVSVQVQTWDPEVYEAAWDPFSNDEVIAVAAGSDTLNFIYRIGKNTKWGQYITNNPSGDCVFAVAKMVNGVPTQTAMDTGFINAQ